MSISNEITRIQNGVSEQEELISQIFTTVAAKSAGGGVQSVNGKTGQVYLTSEDIPFSDGETFQQKYDAGNLKVIPVLRGRKVTPALPVRAHTQPHRPEDILARKPIFTLTLQQCRALPLSWKQFKGECA